MYLLGDVFLRNFYSVYDYDRQSVSFGVNIHAKDQASMFELTTSYKNVWTFLAIMSIPSLVILLIYVWLTGNMKLVLIDSLTTSQIKQERDFLLALSI